MKTITLTAVISIALGLAVGWFFFRSAQQESESGERKIRYWVDPMHPEYKSDKPGTAPDCGMDLVPVYEDEGEEASTDGPAIPGAVKITPEKQQLIGVQTELVGYQEAEKVIRAVGQITYAEPKLAFVTIKFEGYIEELFVDYTGKLVEKGQPLFSVYSPELVSTQEEYLLAYNNLKAYEKSSSSTAASGAHTLLESAKRRLSFWDITDSDVAELERTGAIKKNLTVYSPVRGNVLEKMAVRGMKVMPGMNLYEIADLSTVWIQAEVYENEVPLVKLGQQATVTLSYGTGEVFRGRVTYIYPILTPETRTIKVRLEFPNPGEKLKPGMYANVNLLSSPGRQLSVPEEAVMDTGTEQLVFVAHAGGYFEPRKVALGAKAGDRYLIVGGLNEGEKVVTSGNFLVDSESRLKSATGAMAGMGHGGHGGGEPETSKPKQETPKSKQPDHSQHQQQAPKSEEPDHSKHQQQAPKKDQQDHSQHQAPNQNTSSEQSGHDMGEVTTVDGKKYTCSMHPEVVMDAPGNCPKCKMALVEMVQ